MPNLKFIVRFFLILILTTPILSLESKSASPTWVEEFPTPVLIQDNEDAINLRLKLLDQASAGSQVDVVAFLFDNGFSTRKLSAHMCQASMKGVKVRLVVDSKSGGDPATDDFFDNNPNAQINEENFKYLAMCGVDVFIHNYIDEWSSSISGLTLGKVRAPCVFQCNWPAIPALTGHQFQS